MIILRENQKKIDTVVFDLGNVLLDYSPYRFMGELGISPTLHQRIAKAMFENPDVWLELDRGNLDNAGVAAKAIENEPLLRREILYYTKNWSDLFLAIPENVAAFYRIKEAGCKTYILSNFSKETFETIRKRNTFIADMDGMIISSFYHVNKPDPAIYRLLIDTYTIQPESAVFIDDIRENTAAAEEFGFNTITLPDQADIAPYFIFPDEGSRE